MEAHEKRETWEAAAAEERGDQLVGDGEAGLVVENESGEEEVVQGQRALEDHGERVESDVGRLEGVEDELLFEEIERCLGFDEDDVEGLASQLERSAVLFFHEQKRIEQVGVCLALETLGAEQVVGLGRVVGGQPGDHSLEGGERLRLEQQGELVELQAFAEARHSRLLYS